MRECFLCGELTEGSVGAAGIKWTAICPSCKKTEDDAYAHRIQTTGKQIEKIMEAFK